MSLIDDARAFARSLTENEDDFAVELTCTDELGEIATLSGLVNEIGLSTDPETGALVAGKQASAVISGAVLRASGLTTPKAIPDGASAPWLVSWTGADSVVRLTKVVDVVPDENPGIDLLTLKLETYEQ